MTCSLEPERVSEPTQTAKERLAVLELAQTVGNVAEACRRANIDRTSFYQWRRRYKQEGIGGLEDRPPISRRHPHATPPRLIQLIRTLSLKHPSYGCERLAETLSRSAKAVSSVTVQKRYSTRPGLARSKTGGLHSTSPTLIGIHSPKNSARPDQGRVANF